MNINLIRKGYKKNLYLLSCILFALFLLSSFTGTKYKPDFPLLKGKYLGQKPPGMKPEIFAPGIISIEGQKYRESDINFWPDGMRCIFARFGDGIPDFTLFESKVENGVWTKPKVSEVLNDGGYLPCVTYDGLMIIYTPTESARNYPPYLWFVQNIDGVWSSPKLICIGMYPSATQDGTIYYTHGIHIVRLRFIDGVYQDIEVIGPHIYSNYEDGHPFIAPDESYIIFDSSTRPQVEDNELFISFRTGDNTWTKPQNMKDILGIKPTGKARVTYDGKYLFFTSRGDIYWVDAKVIEKLKPKEMK